MITVTYRMFQALANKKNIQVFQHLKLKFRAYRKKFKKISRNIA